MSSVDTKLLEDFLTESKNLVEKMVDILEKAEGQFSQVKSLEKYSNYSDRIMGAARTFALQINDPQHPINKVADYTAICKLVGQKAAEIRDNPEFFNVCVALLLDGTEVLAQMINGLKNKNMQIKELFSDTFLDRLKWVSARFGDGLDGVDLHKGKNTKLNQDDVDELLKKLGF